jgi:hypothetical protein
MVVPADFDRYSRVAPLALMDMPPGWSRESSSHRVFLGPCPVHESERSVLEELRRNFSACTRRLRPCRKPPDDGHNQYLTGYGHNINSGCADGVRLSSQSRNLQLR